MLKSKIYIANDTVALSLRTIIYIIIKKKSKTKASSIIRNFFNIAVAIFVYAISIIKLYEKRF